MTGYLYPIVFTTFYILSPHYEENIIDYKYRYLISSGGDVYTSLIKLYDVLILFQFSKGNLTVAGAIHRTVIRVVQRSHPQTVVSAPSRLPSSQLEDMYTSNE